MLLHVSLSDGQYGSSRFLHTGGEDLPVLLIQHSGLCYYASVAERIWKMDNMDPVGS
jgi:hypothetical protein